MSRSILSAARSLITAAATTAAVCLAAAFAPAAVGAPAATISAMAPAARFNLESWKAVERGSIDPSVFELAFRAAACAIRSGLIDEPATLTVIDYSRPSTEERLWVFDLHEPALLYEELVAHGKESGANMATRFSNEPNSHQSSLGLFRTEDAYVGRNGYSLRLRGLDEGFNDRAYERAIVMHGAPYVSEGTARANGRIGRSWGCPALREGVARAVIDRVKGTGLVFAYYPDSDWLASSKFLGDCAGSVQSRAE